MKQNSNRNRSNGRHGRFNNNNNRRNGNANGNNITRNTAFDSTSPAGRVRGTAAQLIEKYMSLAKDAKNQDDRILFETYMQYADHYTRMLELAAMNDAQRQPVMITPLPATTAESLAVEKDEAETTQCGLIGADDEVPGAEAAAEPEACDVVEQAENQKSDTVIAMPKVQRRRPHRINRTTKDKIAVDEGDNNSKNPPKSEQNIEVGE